MRPRTPCPLLSLSRPLLTPSSRGGAGWPGSACGKWPCANQQKEGAGPAPSPHRPLPQTGSKSRVGRPYCFTHHAWRWEGRWEAVGEVGSVPARSHPGGSTAEL